MLIGFKWNIRRFEFRFTHVHSNLTIFLKIQHHFSSFGAYDNFVAINETFLLNKTCEAACAIATLFYFRTVRVEDTIVEVLFRIVRRFHHQQLVEANAEVSVSQLLNFFFREKDVLSNVINNHEIVTQTVHFRKLNLH